MKIQKNILVVLVIMSIFLSGCKSINKIDSNVIEIYKTQEIKLYIQSERTMLIPAILTIPITDDDFPLVVMAHGHSGSKEESGGFTDIANALSSNGIAVIRMDFPGCGESEESFIKNTINNMVDDVVTCKNYVVNNYNISSDSIGLFGYSMGGRVIQTILNYNYIEDVKGIVLLAPAVDKYDIINKLGGIDVYNGLKDKANSQGSIEFTTIFGAKLDLSIEWFEQLENDTPLDDVKPFDGVALVIYSEEDKFVSPMVSKLEAEKLKANLVSIDGASHFYGFHNNKALIRQTVIEATVKTFKEAFKKY